MTLQNVYMYNAVVPSYCSDDDKDNINIKATAENREEVDRLLGLL